MAAEPGGGGLGGPSPLNEKSEGAKGMFSPPQYLAYMQLRTLGKCRFRPSGGFVKPTIVLYAPRQPMVALRLDNPAGAQSLAQVSPPNIFFVPRACIRDQQWSNCEHFVNMISQEEKLGHVS